MHTRYIFSAKPRTECVRVCGLYKKRLTHVRVEFREQLSVQYAHINCIALTVDVVVVGLILCCAERKTLFFAQHARNVYTLFNVRIFRAV